MEGIQTHQTPPTSGKLPDNNTDARDIQGLRDGVTRCGVEE